MNSKRYMFKKSIKCPKIHKSNMDISLGNQN